MNFLLLSWLDLHILYGWRTEQLFLFTAASKTSTTNWVCLVLNLESMTYSRFKQRLYIYQITNSNYQPVIDKMINNFQIAITQRFILTKLPGYQISISDIINPSDYSHTWRIRTSFYMLPELLLQMAKFRKNSFDYHFLKYYTGLSLHLHCIKPIGIIKQCRLQDTISSCQISPPMI